MTNEEKAIILDELARRKTSVEDRQMNFTHDIEIGHYMLSVAEARYEAIENLVGRLGLS